MTVYEVLELIAGKGIYLYLEDQKLKFTAKPGALTAELKGLLREFKPQIMTILAEQQQAQQASSGQDDGPKIKDYDKSGDIPVSFAQQRLWFIDQLGNGSLEYNMPGAMVISGEFNQNAFESALRALIERHQALRTHFVLVDGEPTQVIKSDYQLPVTYIDLSDISEQQQTLELEQLKIAQTTTPFDLGSDLMLQVQVVNLQTNQQSLLLYTLHHIASDAWSMTIFHQQLNYLYQRFCQGLTDDLPPLPVQYADYAIWQRQWLEGAVLEQQLAFWQQQLKDIPKVHKLPLDKSRPAEQTFNGGMIYRVIGADLLARLDSLKQQHRVTLFMLAEAALAVLLSRYSGESDIVIGTPIANRLKGETEGVIGFFVNTLVMRNDLSKDVSFNQLLQQTRTMILDCYQHQDVPFETLVEALKPRRDLSHTPVFQVMLALHAMTQSQGRSDQSNGQQGNTEQPQTAMQAVNINQSAEQYQGINNHTFAKGEQGVARFDLTVNLSEAADQQGDKLIVAMEYNLDLFEQQTIEQMLLHFERLLEAVCLNPERPVSRLDFISVAEQQQILAKKRVSDANNHQGSGIEIELVRGFGQANNAVLTAKTQQQLLNLPEVKDAAVLVIAKGFDLDLEPSAGNQDARHFDDKVVAFIVANQSVVNDSNHTAQLSATLVKSIRSQNIPYLIPSAFYYLDTLPLNQDGSIDIGALSAYVEQHMFANLVVFEPPEGEIETIVAEIWAELLNVEKVSRNDNFFDLGGHSLITVKMIESLKAQGLQVDLRSIFNAQSLKELAANISTEQQASFALIPNLIADDCEYITPEMLNLVELNQQQIDHIAAKVPMGMANIADIYPLTALQEGFLFHSIASEMGDTYIGTALASVRSKNQLDSMLGALQSIIDRHDIFRTGVFWQDLPRPVQVVFRAAKLRVTQVSLNSDEDCISQMRARMATDRLTMDLNQAPLFEVEIAPDPNSRKWYVIVKMHHIVNDFQTLQMFKSEISLYMCGMADALQQGVPYRHYVAQSIAYTDSGETERFFGEKLKGFSEPSIPFGMADVHADGSNIEEARQLVEPQLAKRTHQCARKHRVTASTLFHLAWAIVMAKTSGREDVVFGTVLMGRMQGTEGADKVMGMLLNTLPLRLTLSGKSIEQMVQMTHLAMAELLDHELASLALAQKCSDVSGDGPLFSAVFNYRHVNAQASGEQLEIDGPRPRGVRIHKVSESANYPIGVSVDEEGEYFMVSALVDKRIEAARFTAYLCGALELVVSALEKAPQTQALSLGINLKEEQQLLTQWNDTGVDYAKDQTIAERFAAQVAKSPEAIALSWQDEQQQSIDLTYQQLHRKTNQLARCLLAKLAAGHFNTGDIPRIGVSVESSQDMVVAALAIVKAGGCYVPLDSNYPQARLAHMVKDSKVQIIVGQQSNYEALFDGQLSDHQVSLIDIAAAQCYQPYADDAVDCGKNAADLAYVIYTSGSTGKPKGVLVSERNVVSLISDTQMLALDSQHSVAQASNHSFDAATYEMWGALLNGARLVAVPKEVLLSNERMAAHIETQQINVLFITTALFNRIAEDLPQALKPLKKLLFGGEAHFIDSIAKVLEACPDTDVYHVYGPTECTTYSTGYLIEREKFAADPIAPIGVPFDNSQLYVLDNQQIKVPIGVVGELYIGGDGVAQGYQNRPVETAKAFVENPYGAGKLYRTGDLVRFLDDGNVEFIGRADFQVKVRGFRIELNEIEAQLLKHTQVQATTVLAREYEPGQRRLEAYVVLANAKVENIKKGETIEGFKQSLKAVLPNHMVPQIYVFIDQLPITPNGKIDVKALPMPSEADLVNDEYVAPRNDIERRVCEIWAQTLGVERVGIYDNFFALGGHSLIATRLTGALRQAFNVEVPFRVLFEQATAAGVSDYIRQNNDEFVLPDIEVIDRSEPLRLSYAQQRLWFVDQLGGGSVQYNMVAGLQIGGAFDKAAFEQALWTMLERHEVLRGVYQSNGEQVFVAIGNLDILPLESFDLTDLTPEQQEQAVQSHGAEQSSTPFDLSQDSMLKVKLLKLSDDNHFMIFNIHHIASDGRSMAIFEQEFSALYHAYSQGQDNPLAQLPVQYADYAHWQRGWLQGEMLEKQLSYWQTQLANIPAVHSLPLDKARPAEQSFVGASYRQLLSEDLSERVKVLCEQAGVTLFMFVQAVFSILIARVSNETDVVLGVPIAGRDHRDIDGLIGFFVNTLVLRSDLADNPSFAEVLTNARKTTLDAYSHQYIQFEMLVEALNVKRSLAHHPIVQIYLNVDETVNRHVIEEQEQHDHTEQATKTDLTLYVHKSGSQLLLYWAYLEQLFSPQFISQMADSFEHIVSQVVENQDMAINQLALMPKAAQLQQLEQLVDIEQSEDLPAVHQQIAAVSVTNPEKVAIVDSNGATLSYGDLEVKATALAKHLQANVNSPQQFVGIFLPRGIDMAIAALAVLKAGFAYGPISAELPDARIEYMIANAQMNLLITNDSLQGRLPADISVMIVNEGLYHSAADKELKVPHIVADTPSHLIYTSGSTGLPKGVVGNHGSLHNRVKWMSERFPFEADEVVCQLTSVGFIRAVWELMLPLTQGVKISVANNDTVKDPQLLAQFIADHQITRLVTAPSLAREVISLPEPMRAKLASIRYWFVSGEILTSALANDFAQNLPEVVLCNLYGSTEVMSDVSYCVVDQKLSSRSVPIGHGISNTPLLILDEAHNLLPPLIPGELYVAGPALANGYVGDQALSEEKFIINPFNQIATERLYRTGDLARYLPDGNIECINRVDNQVKIRGFRIELGDIEAQLQKIEQVKAAVVLAHQIEGAELNGDDSKRLCAYLVDDSIDNSMVDANDGLVLELDRVYKKQLTDQYQLQIQTHLPDYMKVDSFILLSAMPLKANGKIDKRALPQPSNIDLAFEQYVPPRNEIETQLCQIWQQLLGVEQVGIQDNFFALGGHSLLATRLVSMVREQFEIEVPLKAVFERPKLEDFAHLVSMELDAIALEQAKNMHLDEDDDDLEEGTF